MRLDKYLKVSRLIKRRTMANEACDNGLVSVNGRPARASYEVKVGDQISLRLGAREVTVEVLSVQETVRREVYEEVGLRVKNLRYYKSQPWSFSGTLLFGFFAELDGDDDSITLDTRELSTADWFTREEAPAQPLNISLTSEMIWKFKNGEV